MLANLRLPFKETYTVVGEFDVACVETRGPTVCGNLSGKVFKHSADLNQKSFLLQKPITATVNNANYSYKEQLLLKEITATVK